MLDKSGMNRIEMMACGIIFTNQIGFLSNYDYFIDQFKTI